MKRGSGILLHISSLPSEYGIGTMGDAAYKFIDYLKDSGCRYWQMLPVCMIGAANSPYQSYSAYGGNPLFIDLDMLVKDELLEKCEFESINWGFLENIVDYKNIFFQRMKVLEIAFHRFLTKDMENFGKFCQENHNWIEDYSLFMALKEKYKDCPWQEFPEEIKNRQGDAIGYYRDKLWDRMDFYKFIQYKFFQQWEKMKVYANSKEISLIGDIPMYVAEDSVDTWAHRKEFQLDDKGYPTSVAGVPPDYFSQTGQHWGNPLYNWEVMKENNYLWWRERLIFQQKLFDSVRIDHFRGIESYWSIPRNSKTAADGHWVKGPDMDFVQVVKDALPCLEIIAEDLGLLTDEVKDLLEKSGFPGMKVLQFAFTPNKSSEYLPHRHIMNCVIYTGTHDNDTLKGFIDKADKETVEYIKDYFNIDNEDFLDRVLIRAAFSSVANVAIIQMQEVLGLGSEARMNIPSTTKDNWVWRLNKSYREEKNILWLKKLNSIYGR